MARVMVVDEDEIQRRGLMASLASEGVEVVAATAAPAAVPPDAIIAGLRPVAERWDHLGAIDQLARLRSRHPDARLIALLDLIPHPLVRLRLVSAGVDEIVARDDMRTAASLGELVRGKRLGDAPEPVCVELAAASVPAGADPTRALDLVHAEGLTGVFSGVERSETLSRRSRITLRRKIANAGNLRRRLSAATGGPHRDDTLPTWREVTGFVRAARGCGDRCGCPEAGFDRGDATLGQTGLAPGWQTVPG